MSDFLKIKKVVKLRRKSVRVLCLHYQIFNQIFVSD